MKVRELINLYKHTWLQTHTHTTVFLRVNLSTGDLRETLDVTFANNDNTLSS